MTGQVIQGLFVSARPSLAASPASGTVTAPRPPGAGCAPALQPHRGAFPLDGNQLGLVRGAGRPLPDGVRARMEAALGADFSTVRVHVGPQAARLGALAFTIGSEIYFAPGRYQPDTIQGRQVLGHELAHVLQQRAGRVRNPLGGGLTVVQDRILEAEADRLGHRAAAAFAALQPKMPAAASPVHISAPISTAPGSYRLAAGMHGRPVGSVMVHARAHGAVEVTDLGVAPGHREHGVGALLLASAARTARQLGRTKINLAAQDKGSGHLVRWYQQLGFTRTGVNHRGYQTLEAPVGRLLAPPHAASAPPASGLLQRTPAYAPGVADALRPRFNSPARSPRALQRMEEGDTPSSLKQEVEEKPPSQAPEELPKPWRRHEAIARLLESSQNVCVAVAIFKKRYYATANIGPVAQFAFDGKTLLVSNYTGTTGPEDFKRPRGDDALKVHTFLAEYDEELVITQVGLDLVDVHAELKMLDFLVDNKAKGEVTFYISKVCCLKCRIAIDEWNRAGKSPQIICPGGHANLYAGWTLPPCILKDEALALKIMFRISNPDLSDSEVSEALKDLLKGEKAQQEKAEKELFERGRSRNVIVGGNTQRDRSQSPAPNASGFAITQGTANTTRISVKGTGEPKGKNQKKEKDTQQGKRGRGRGRK